jgi:hypothetical protein
MKQETIIELINNGQLDIDELIYLIAEEIANTVLCKDGKAQINWILKQGYSWEDIEEWILDRCIKK